MELGMPMITMYLLDNPDHYMSHCFTPFNWNMFVKEVEKAWHKVILIKKSNRIVGLPNIYNYTFCAEELAGLCVYRSEERRVGKECA